jgi:lysophospholipase L1-like esterase
VSTCPIDECVVPARRAALQRIGRLMSAAGMAATVAACGGGAPAPAPLEPPPPPAPDPNTPLGRLHAALRRASGGPPVAATPVDVFQGASNVSAPTLGPSARILPVPAGFGTNPNPGHLANLAEVWGHRRDTWALSDAGLFGTTAENASWYRAVQVKHPAAGLQTDSVVGLHFVHTGARFEVLFAGSDVRVTLLADGQYMAPRFIATQLAAGVAGAPLNQFNTYVRFDFGSSAMRQVSLYGRSTQGLCALAIGQGDSIAPWDRSGEASMCAMSDSYGGARATHWGVSGPFWEAAARLGIPHVDLNAIGGTGYAPIGVDALRLDPANAFGGRLATCIVRAPDLFITAGGINDNNGAALPPYATAEAARLGFQNAVFAYFRDLRAALPDAVLAATGPWTPNEFALADANRAKADTVKGALQAIAGPWVFLDNVRGGWSNSAGASGASPGRGWQTGSGREGAPAGDGNADLYISADGTHPTEAGVQYLAGMFADTLRAAILAL